MDTLINVVWTYDTFENNSKINQMLEKYLKENCELVLDQYFFFKYFMEIDFITVT